MTEAKVIAILGRGPNAPPLKGRFGKSCRWSEEGGECVIVVFCDDDNKVIEKSYLGMEPSMATRPSLIERMYDRPGCK